MDQGVVSGFMSLMDELEASEEEAIACWAYLQTLLRERHSGVIRNIYKARAKKKRKKRKAGEGDHRSRC